MRAANREPTDPDQGLSRVPCSVCGQPSAGWVYSTMTDDQGHDVVEAYSACEAHRLEVIQGTDSQAS